MPAPTSIGVDKETKELVIRLSRRLNVNQNSLVKCGLKLIELLLRDNFGKMLVYSLLHGSDPLPTVQDLSIKFMIDILKQIENDVKNIKDRIAIIEKRVENLGRIVLGKVREEEERPRETTAPIAVIETVIDNSNLPEWMRDNPWISIIAGRGAIEKR
ncbi:MAG: hypothetical protein GXO26_04335 [Crenarchaeota archaeon]|nr:hypothetical protein [Thermoproteota archaeon]